MSSVVHRAERALYRRAALACDAAGAAGVPGQFRVWQHAGVLAVLATDPALRLLATVSGVTPETVAAAVEVVHSPLWQGITPMVLITMDTVEETSGGDAIWSTLDKAGLVPVDDRAIAIRQLDGVARDPVEPHSQQVIDAGTDVGTFNHVLLAGYEVVGVVAEFIATEHGAASVRRFLVVEQDLPVAAAAMTIHDDVAVFGGASTMSTHRRRGAQALTLEHRLRIAADAGCTLAVATARPGSTSVANLHRAGFRIVRRAAWQKA